MVELIERYIETFNPESQTRLRTDLERYGTVEQQLFFLANVHRDRCLRMLDFLDEMEKPFYIKAWNWIRKSLFAY